LRADIPSVFTSKIASQRSKRPLSAWNILTFLTSLWCHECYLFSVFRWILPATFRRFFVEIKHLRSRAPEKYFTRLLGTYSPQFLLWHWRRIASTEFFPWFQCTQTVFKINTIIYRNISYLLMNHEMYRLWSSTNTKLSSCFEYRWLMIISKYFVGGGLWRLLNINLFITAARPLKPIVNSSDCIYETIIYTICTFHFILIIW
jgi:hypothetical protein